jgi:DNA polymerase-3 subunit beta
MELKIGVQELSRALARSQGIVEKKSTMPILSHVLLEAKKSGELAVSATDLDVSVSGGHTAEVLKEGALAVSARTLYEIVKALPEAQVALKKTPNNHLEVRSGPAEFRIVGLPPDVYYISHLIIKITPRDLILVTVSAISISLMATLFPSWQAAQLDPAETLRYE